MRFALAATAAAAVVAIPLAVAASGPQMSAQDFLSAVRCTAYEDVMSNDPSLAQARYSLNSEARRQAPETVERAVADIDAIAREATEVANPSEAAMIRGNRTAACSSPQAAGRAA